MKPISDKKIVRVLFSGVSKRDYLDLKDHFSAISEMIFVVEWYLDYAESIKELLSNDYDLCFVDRNLGGHSGFDFLRDIRAHDLPTPVILLSSGIDPKVEQEAIRLGAADFLIKNQIYPYVLERSLRYAIYRKGVNAELRHRDGERLIQERMASVGMLASGMAHEIGTPLGVIRGRAEVLLMKNSGNELLNRDLQIIVDQVDKVSKLMRSLLNLARGDDQRASGRVDVKQVVSEVLNIMEPMFSLIGVRVVNLISTETHFQIQADSEPFHQILLNIFQNSLHAIETAIEGGRSQGHMVKIWLELGPGHYILVIQDTGCGISALNLRKLFRPFFTTKGIGGGTGLGLALSHRVIQSWKGEIKVESEEGVGTEVRISVPRDEREALQEDFGSAMVSNPSR